MREFQATYEVENGTVVETECARWQAQACMVAFQHILSLNMKQSTMRVVATEEPILRIAIVKKGD